MTGKIWFSVFILIATAWQTVSSAHINDNCTDTDQCLSDIKFSACLEGHCICNNTDEFVDSNNVTRCKGPPDANCSNDTNFKCVDHASCLDNVCTCNDGYAEDFFFPTFSSLQLFICDKNKSIGFGKECEGSKQCNRSAFYSYCNIDHKCACSPSTTLRKISGKWVCAISVGPNEHCGEIEICDVKHASCKNHICTCDKGYQGYELDNCILKPSPESKTLPVILIIVCCLGASIVLLSIAIFVYVKCKIRRLSKYKSIN